MSNEEAYELDGIRTAMTKTVESDRDLIFVTCPCGYEVAQVTRPAPEKLPTFQSIRRESFYAALRFHFTHCPQAKL